VRNQIALASVAALQIGGSFGSKEQPDMPKPKPKSKRGRPPGRKDRKPRGSGARVIAPPEIKWLDKVQAAGELGVSLASINRNLVKLGAVKMMGRVRFDREELNRRARALQQLEGLAD
jgi:hypothetical protein